MVSAVSEDGRSARGRARTLDSVQSGALGKSLRAMAGEHSGLVHQPAGVVGASHTGLVPEIPNFRSQISDLRRHRAAGRGRELAAGCRHARYLVLVLALGL